VTRSRAVPSWTFPVTAFSSRAIEWSKQNLADSVQAADDLQVRFTDEGRQYPPASGTVPHVRFLGAGFPDYPWLFATDGR
jgi:hypothetical protein